MGTLANNRIADDMANLLIGLFEGGTLFRTADHEITFHPDAEGARIGCTSAVVLDSLGIPITETPR